MSNTALQKASEPKSLREVIGGDYFKKQVALALPKHMTPDRFVRVGLTAMMKNPKLLDCTQESVIQCLLNCSSLGLEPDGRRAHLIPYKDQCTLILDYKGIVELAKRSGDVSNVFAQIVCEGDSFDWENGVVTHRIDFAKPRGEMYAVYATISFKDGTKQSDVMTKEEVEAIRKRSRSGTSGPWVTDFNEMAKKTVFRRASKWVTLSPEVQDALDSEEDFQKVDHRSSVSAPQFSPPPPPLLPPVTQKSVSQEEEDDVPMSPPPEPAKPEPTDVPSEEQPETATQFAIRMLSDASVAFDDFRDFVLVKRLKGFADASSWASYDEVPAAIYEQMTTKLMADCLKTFGKKKQ